MASLTAVELGADTCALARTSVRRGEVHVSAAEVLDPAAFPGLTALTTALRQARHAGRLPRRCRAVVWGLPDGANRKDAAVKPLLAPLTGAGFKVERVVSPCNALSALARLKTSRGDGSTCWVAINRGGVAIVVIRPGKQLYAHSFAWDSSIGSSGSQARLLQRYSLVSVLSPEVKRAMAEARRYGTPVDAVVTCGNLPDLRSLTMPLIEELDVEVETLDSLEGLVVKPQAVERLAEIAPAIRLACAAAIARGTRPWDPSKKRSASHVADTVVRAAALAFAVLGIAYLWYLKGLPPTAPAIVTRSAPKAAPVTSRVEGRGSIPPPAPPAVSVPAPAPKSNPPVVSVPPPSAAKAAGRSSTPAVTVPAKKPESTSKTIPPAIPWKPPVVTAPPPRASVPDPRPLAPKPIRPAVSVPAPAPKSNAPAVNAANTVPQARLQPFVMLPLPNTSRPAAPSSPPAVRPPVVTPPPPAARSNPPAATVPPPAVSVPATKPESNPPAPRSNAALNLPAIPTDKPEAPVAARAPGPGAAGASRGPMPALLKDAVPRVTAILVSQDRRFATVAGGQIIGIGDLLGRRTVIGMDERSVVLQEPSGVQIRIGLGGRLLGVGRAAR